MHNSPLLGNIQEMQARLRTLIDQVARSAEADAVLVRRFVSTRDSAAFAELVRRYGCLVWGQCRNLLQSEADADDAFQATFLTLSRAARTLKDTNKLGPWLHGVAYRVCLNARRVAARRGKREKATAKPEAVRPVADSAWDAAFAAVHDELAKLPETLRAPFVLCVLEGKGTTQAAEQLGLKLGTFSARLSRAKQTLFERLNARGLTAGVAAIGAVAVGASSVPAAVVGRACDLAAGGTAPANILSLSHGVLGMAAMNAKRWVMAAVLAGGLATGVGGVWTANAQDKPKPVKEQPGKPADPEKAELLRLQELLKAEQAKRLELEAEYQKQAANAKQQAAEAERAAKEKKLEWTQKSQEGKVPEFLYLGQGAGYSPTAEEFEKTVRQVEAKGYSFVGVVIMKGQTKAKDNEAVPTLVFRRAAVAAKEKDAVRWTEKEAADDRAAQQKALQAQIDKLNAELDRLTGKKADPLKWVEKEPGKQPEKKPADDGVFVALVSDLGGDADAAAKLVVGLIQAKFGAWAKENAKVVVQDAKGMQGVFVYGVPKEKLEWLGGVVKQVSPGKPKE